MEERFSPFDKVDHEDAPARIYRPLIENWFDDGLKCHVRKVTYTSGYMTDVLRMWMEHVDDAWVMKCLRDNGFKASLKRDENVRCEYLNVSRCIDGQWYAAAAYRDMEEERSKL